MPTNSLFPSASSQKVANIWNTSHAAADEGNYWIATNPTVGTPIVMVQQIASSTDASAVMLINNQWPTTDAKDHRIYLQYLKMQCAGTYTSAASAQFAWRGDAVTRSTSAGSLIVPVNVNMDIGSPGSSAQIYFGALVIATAMSASARTLSKGIIDYAIPVVGDQWVMTFGDQAMPTNILAATGAKQVTVPCGPIVIGPQQSVALNLWFPSIGAVVPSFEFELGYIERPAGL